jgi:hypothetical protein
MYWQDILKNYRTSEYVFSEPLTEEQYNRSNNRKKIRHHKVMIQIGKENQNNKIKNFHNAQLGKLVRGHSGKPIHSIKVDERENSGNRRARWKDDKGVWHNKAWTKQVYEKATMNERFKFHVSIMKLARYKGNDELYNYHQQIKNKLYALGNTVPAGKGSRKKVWTENTLSYLDISEFENPLFFPKEKTREQRLFDRNKI